MDSQDLDRILALFPEHLRQRDLAQKNLLKEYVEVLSLHYLSYHPVASKMIFIGGINLRILKGINRFSEDLDFDCRGLSREDFIRITDDLIEYLRQMGFDAVAKERESDRLVAMRRSIYFPELLFDLKISPYREERFLMKVEAQDQRLSYTPLLKMVQRYGFTFNILTPPDEVLLAMKYTALMSRGKGRDIYDIMFLSSLGIAPDMETIREKYPEITTESDLYDCIQGQLEEMDLESKKRDLVHLLINPLEIGQIDLFPQLIELKRRSMQD